MQARVLGEVARIIRVGLHYARCAVVGITAGSIVVRVLVISRDSDADADADANENQKSCNGANNLRGVRIMVPTGFGGGLTIHFERRLRAICFSSHELLAPRLEYGAESMSGLDVVAGSAA